MRCLISLVYNPDSAPIFLTLIWAGCARIIPQNPSHKTVKTIFAGLQCKYENVWFKHWYEELKIQPINLIFNTTHRQTGAIKISLTYNGLIAGNIPNDACVVYVIRAFGGGPPGRMPVYQAAE
jgi:hypothetical protein